MKEVRETTTDDEFREDSRNSRKQDEQFTI